MLFYSFLKVFENIPDENDRSKRKASWLNISLYKSSRTFVGILFGPIALWILSREEMMSETSIELIKIIKTELLFIGSFKKMSKKLFFIFNKGLNT